MSDFDEAVELLELAMHLRMRGESPSETWAGFDYKCENFLRRIDGHEADL